MKPEQSETDSLPAVSIGLPVYNGERSISKAIAAVLAQSFDNFELIVSDNASTDGTEALCRAFAARDPRVRYIRQPRNLGATGNFRFVLEQARGRYYMWAAADDLRSPDFLSENVAFLETHPEYVASTCPNCFEGDEEHPDRIVRFAVEGNLAERYLVFLRHCWQSHGIFYSLMRTDVIRQCDIPGHSFTAADWAIDIFLASRGGIHRTEAGLAVFGRGGVSSQAGAWRAFRNQSLELLLPLYRFSRYALGLMKPLPWRAWWPVFSALLRLNVKASADQAYAALYAVYCRYLKSAS
jgi:glycosyltransferase involved in cell wall biosynthesis